MKESILTRATGTVLVGIGLFAMIGWYAHIPSFISIYSGQTNIVFNSALGFFLLGMVFLLSEKFPFRQKIYTVTGVIIAILGLSTLIENIFNVSTGLDQLFVTSWLIDQNPHPGRMAGNSALAFLFSGFVLMLFSYTHKKSIAMIVQISIFCTLIIGFSALAGYLFDIEVLYGWNSDAKMSLLSAIANSFSGLGLWSLWKKENTQLSGNKGREAIALGFTILFCTLFLSGFAIFKMLFPVSFPNHPLADAKSAVLVTLIIGASLLLWQLVPLIRQLLYSEKNLLKANFLLKESESKLRSAFDNATTGMHLILQNMNAAKYAEDQLRHLAYHDSLTGLFNRNRLAIEMRETVLNAERYQRGFVLIFLDLDHFKNINDTIGHDAGDMLLQIVGQRLKNTVRSSDIVARIGGDEFVLVLNELNQLDKVSDILEKILSHLLQPITIKGHEIYVTTSVGVSVYPNDGKDVQTLMKNADLALYRAKELGRNNYQFCTFEMTTKAQQKMAQQNALVQAMAKNEFVLFFQPTFNLMTQSISGVEALLRWPNSEYSSINTTEIIRLAEDTGLIVALNEWVFRAALAQVKKWHEEGFFPLTLSVNLSGRQFKQPTFVENLMRMLEESQFPAEYLELEMTEGLIMQDPEYILHTLQSLKKNNISIAIDDFGTGYSSLDYLRRFSIDKIKIDKKFIQTLNSDSESTVIVSAIIAMSNKLGIQTVAEGVETKAQYEFLLQEKCTEIQGYYLCPPADSVTITRFLKNPVVLVP